MCFLKFQTDKDYITHFEHDYLVWWFANYYLYLFSSFFMFVTNKETAFNYCTQWSGVDDQIIDCSIISMGAMSHNI